MEIREGALVVVLPHKDTSKSKNWEEGRRTYRSAARKIDICPSNRRLGQNT